MNWFGNFCILFLACVISVDMEFELLQRELFESTLDKITWEWYNMSMSNECGFISRLNLKINSLTMIPRHGNPQEQEYQHQILWNKRLNQMFWRSKKSPQICRHNIYQVTKNEVIHRFKSSAQKRKNLVIFSVFVCNRGNDNGEHQRHWNVCNSRVFKTYYLKCISVTCYNSEYEGHCRPWETIIEQAHCVAKFIQSIFAFCIFYRRVQPFRFCMHASLVW